MTSQIIDNVRRGSHVLLVTVARDIHDRPMYVIAAVPSNGGDMAIYSDTIGGTLNYIAKLEDAEFRVKRLTGGIDTRWYAELWLRENVSSFGMARMSEYMMRSQTKREVTWTFDVLAMIKAMRACYCSAGYEYFHLAVAKDVTESWIENILNVI